MWNPVYTKRIPLDASPLPTINMLSCPIETARTDWKRPSVIEFVLGVQFDPLANLTNGHLGWFWGEMHDTFPTSDDVPPIPPVVEHFDEAILMGFPGLGFRQASGDSRLRMSSLDGTRMIQVQNGWLIVNWMGKPDFRYPGFTGVKELFNDAMSRFGTFLTSRNLGTIKPNLWEVTYINHIPQGTVWNTLADIPMVFPGLFGEGQCPNGTREAVHSTWSWRLEPTPGRLRVSVQSAKANAAGSTDILLVRSVARGPLGSENAPTLDEGLNFGRSTVVDTFMGLASEDAKRYWKGETEHDALRPTDE